MTIGASDPVAVLVAGPGEASLGGHPPPLRVTREGCDSKVRIYIYIFFLIFLIFFNIFFFEMGALEQANSKSKWSVYRHIHPQGVTKKLEKILVRKRRNVFSSFSFFFSYFLYFSLGWFFPRQGLKN